MRMDHVQKSVIASSSTSLVSKVLSTVNTPFKNKATNITGALMVVGGRNSGSAHVDTVVASRWSSYAVK